MATQQHPAFDSEFESCDGEWAALCARPHGSRIIARRRRVPSRRFTTGDCGWRRFWRRNPGKSGQKARTPPVLKTKWEEAKASIETNSQILRNAVTTGHKLGGDAEILLANSNILRQSLEETDRVVRKAGELPAVECGEWKSLPRAYAAVVSYLQAVNYEFDEQTFVQYFSAIQETVAFEMLELWQLQALAQLALLESVSLMARRLGRDEASGASGEHRRKPN